MPSSRPDRIRKLLADLVGFDTISDRTNLPLIAHIESYLAGFGVKGERIVDETGQKAALWVTIGPEDRPGFVLSGHTDVVPVVGQDWSHDPFKLAERDGKLYGRGTTDMKGFVAVCLAMVPEMVDARLKTPIHLAISYDEEIGCVGVRPMIDRLQQELPPQELCIIGEPTSMAVATSHKGKLGARCTCHGVAAHSALAPNGLNAIYMANEAIGALRQLQAEVAAGMGEPSPDEVPYTTLHVGRIQGGVALNIVPDNCRFDFEIRNLPGTNAEPLLADFKRRVDAIASGNIGSFPESGIEVEIINEYPSLLTPHDDPAVPGLLAMVGASAPSTVSFGTEGGLFRQALGCATVVCGPGSMRQGHKPDEYVELGQLDECGRFLDRVVEEICI